MCELCVQHGEGKKWYLQAKNYSQDLWNEEIRAKFEKQYGLWEENRIKHAVEADKMIAADFNAYRAMRISQAEQQKKQYWGQIVPIEDAEKILDMSTNIARLPCPCRKVRGVRNAKFCFGLTIERGKSALSTYPDYANEFEYPSREEAKKLFREFDREGLVHMVLAYVPFIYGFCNCDSTYCAFLRTRSRLKHPVGFFKSEYVSTVDWEKCNGCRECMKLCNFGAISYSPAVEKVYIDQHQCHGSGACRSICPKDAITLKDRNSIPSLAKEW